MRKVVQATPLANGLRIYCFPDTASNCGGVGVKAGSVHDPPGKSGLAHVVEHVITRETKEFSSSDLELLHRKYLGGPDDDVNIATDRTSTFYGPGQLLRRTHFWKVMNAFSGFLHPDRRVVGETTMRGCEISAVHNEYHLRGKDVASTEILDLFYATLYPENPVGRRIDCELKDLAAMKKRDVLRFLKKYYVPNNMFVVSMGPTIKETRQFAEQNYGDLLAVPVPDLSLEGRELFPELRSIRSKETERGGISQHHVAIGFPTENFGSKDGVVLDILADALEHRLYRRLREENRDFEGGCYRVDVYAERSSLHGVIYVVFATKSRGFAEYAERAVLEEIEVLKNARISAPELDAFLSREKYVYLDVLQNNPLSLCNMVIDAVCNGDEDLKGVNGYLDELKRVTRTKIQAAAQKYFTKEYARAVIRPA